MCKFRSRLVDSTIAKRLPWSLMCKMLESITINTGTDAGRYFDVKTPHGKFRIYDGPKAMYSAVNIDLIEVA